jgi:hypothetical protein
MSETGACPYKWSCSIHTQPTKINLTSTSPILEHITLHFLKTGPHLGFV